MEPISACPTIDVLLKGYRQGQLSPVAVVVDLLQRIHESSAGCPWAAAEAVLAVERICGAVPELVGTVGQMAAFPSNQRDPRLSPFQHRLLDMLRA